MVETHGLPSFRLTTPWAGALAHGPDSAVLKSYSTGGSVWSIEGGFAYPEGSREKGYYLPFRDQLGLYILYRGRR